MREKGWVRPRQEDAPAVRFALIRRFAEGLAWLRSTDPEQAERLARSVRTYRRRAERLGVRRGDVPDSYEPWGTTAYALGLVALAWHERSEDLWEDARILWRALRRRSLRQQLRARRSALVAEFETLAAEWEAERRLREDVRAANER